MLTRAMVCAWAVAALAGCTSLGGVSPGGDLPGVRTVTNVEDSFRCGELLFTQGCVVLRIERVDSGCAPEVGGYVVCDATIDWNATAGGVEPGSRLSTSAGGEAGPDCQPTPVLPCRVGGSVNHTKHFSGPGQSDTWNVTLVAWLEAPSGMPASSGEFRLEVAMTVRTEAATALTPGESAP